MKTEVKIIISAVCLIGGILFGIAWGDGHAKSAYLKQVRGIDLPWYQTTWLNIHTSDTEVTLRQK